MIAALADAGRRARPRRLPRRRAALRPTSSGRRMRDADGRLLRTYKDGEAKLNAYLEDHAYLLEALLDPLRGDLRGPLVRRRARDRRRDDRALRRPRARRLLHHLGRPRGADRPPQGRRRPPDPVGQLVRRLRPAAPRRADRRARATSEQAESASSRCSAAVAATTRRRSPTCCGRSTSTSPRSARWRWSRPPTATGSTSWPRSSARGFARTSCSPAGRRDPSARS